MFRLLQGCPKWHLVLFARGVLQLPANISCNMLQYLELLLSLASPKSRNATSDGGRSLFRRIHRSSFLRCFFAWRGNSLGNHYNLAEFVMRKDDPAIFWERFHDIYEAWPGADQCLRTFQTDLDYWPPFLCLHVVKDWPSQVVESRCHQVEPSPKRAPRCQLTRPGPCRLARCRNSWAKALLVQCIWSRTGANKKLQKLHDAVATLMVANGLLMVCRWLACVF